MIFSTDMINKSYNLEENNEIFQDDNFSLLEFTIDSIMSEQLEFEYNIMSMNEGIVGKYIKNQINEKIHSLSLKDILDKIFSLFMQVIRTLTDKFWDFLLSMINKGTRLKIYDKKLKSYNGEPISYNMNHCYNTSRLVEDDSSSYRSTIEIEYNRLITELGKISRPTTPIDLANLLDNIKDTMNEFDLNKVRGKLVNKSSVNSEDFISELKKYFYGDNISKKLIIAADVRNMYNFYTDFNRQKALIHQESKKLNNYADSKRKSIHKSTINDFNPNQLAINKGNIASYNAIINIACRNIKNICNIYEMYFATKLDILKEYNTACMEVALKAVYSIVKKDREEKK